MKQLLMVLAVLLIGHSAFSQNWNYIGSSTGLYNASEVDIEISPNGQLYMAYIDTDNGNKATVRKFVNGAWTLVGTAGISGTNSFDVQLVLTGEESPAIAVKRLTLLGSTNYELLEIYKWSGTAWNYTGFGDPIWTYHNRDYSLRANTAGQLLLTFFNRTQTYDMGLITINLSTLAQLGGDLDQGSAGNNLTSWAGTGNNVTVVHEENDIGDYLPFEQYSGGSWDGNGNSLSNMDGTSKMKIEKGIGSANISGVWLNTDATPKLKYKAFNGTAFGTEFTLHTSSTLTDFDFDTQFDNAYVFYRAGSTCYFKQVNPSMAPGATTITTGTGLAPANATSLAAETYYGVHVIAYVSGTKCYVKEYDLEANIEDYDLLEMCEGTSFNNNGDYVVYCLDPNYSHANMTMTCTSQNVAVIPQSQITVSGNGTLYYSLNIGTTNDIVNNTTVDLEFTLFENGNEIGSILVPITINRNPPVAFTFPTSTFCENNGNVSLIGKVSPGGGTWSGTGVSGNNFDPSVFNPSPVMTTYLVYSKTSAQGCVTTDSTQLTINEKPNLVVTATNANCGQTNGSASVAISGGNSPYDTYWSNGSSLTSVANLAPGQYYVNVEDNNGCSAVAVASVASNGITLSGTTSNIDCYGYTSGVIDLTVAGTGPFTYLWSNGQTTQDVGFLAAGPYEVVVSDGQGCSSTASFTLFEPAPLNLAAATIVSPGCAATNGSATVTISGGEQPYSYEWLDGNGDNLNVSTATISGIGAGYLQSVVTDDNGCSATFQVLVSNLNGPLIAIDTIMSASCSGDGEIHLSNVSNNAQDFLWSNGETTQDITDLLAGTYVVEATGQNGCVSVLSATVGSTQPETVEICLVTVDTLTNTNLVVWEKPVTNDIDHFNVYRETSQAGLYQLAGSVDYDDESLFNDLVASPSVRSWRYKISSVDACGTESELSANHKTIHLVVNIGLGSTINLSWDNYEGFVFPEFMINRYTDDDGWQTIQSMPVNLFTYTDTPPTTDGLVYLVTIAPPAMCTAEKAQDFNSARSNKDNRLAAPPTTQSLEELLNNSLTVFPNPSNGVMNVENKSGQQLLASVYDAAGRLLMLIDVMPGISQTDLGTLESGIYQVVFSSGNIRSSHKLTITH